MYSEFAAAIAGIPLLPASAQQEFFDAVRKAQAELVIEGCKRVADTAKDAPIDKRVARYVKLREARAASNREAEALDKAYKEALTAIENSLVADAQAKGVTGFKTEAGTTYLEERMLTSIADENAFFSFVKEQGDLDFFERRVKVAHVKEWMEANDGHLPPGLNVFRELGMKVRRS